MDEKSYSPIRPFCLIQVLIICHILLLTLGGFSCHQPILRDSINELLLYLKKYYFKFLIKYIKNLFI